MSSSTASQSSSQSNSLPTFASHWSPLLKWSIAISATYAARSHPYANGIYIGRHRTLESQIEREERRERNQQMKRGREERELMELEREEGLGLGEGFGERAGIDDQDGNGRRGWPSNSNHRRSGVSRARAGGYDGDEGHIDPRESISDQVMGEDEFIAGMEEEESAERPVKRIRMRSSQQWLEVVCKHLEIDPAALPSTISPTDLTGLLSSNSSSSQLDNKDDNGEGEDLTSPKRQHEIAHDLVCASLLSPPSPEKTSNDGNNGNNNDQNQDQNPHESRFKYQVRKSKGGKDTSTPTTPGSGTPDDPPQFTYSPHHRLLTLLTLQALFPKSKSQAPSPLVPPLSLEPSPSEGQEQRNQEPLSPPPPYSSYPPQSESLRQRDTPNALSPPLPSKLETLSPSPITSTSSSPSSPALGPTPPPHPPSRPDPSWMTLLEAEREVAQGLYWAMEEQLKEKERREREKKGESGSAAAASGSASGGRFGKYMKDTSENVRQSAAGKNKFLKWGATGAGFVLGGVAIGLTGGLAAPAVVPLLASAGIGIFAGAGGAIGLGVLLGFAGGGLGAYRVHRRMAGIGEFEFHKVGEEKEKQDGLPEIPSLSATICCSGFLLDQKEWLTTWESGFSDPSLDAYALKVETSTFLSAGKYLDTYVRDFLLQHGALEVVKHSVLAGLYMSVALPVGIYKGITTALDNSFQRSRDKAEKAGVLLAEVISKRVQGARPVTLVGSSLGAVMVWSCLLELSRLGLTDMVSDVYLISAPISPKKVELAKARSVVAREFVNAYSKEDWVLGIVARLHSLISTRLSYRVAGLGKLEIEGIKDVDLGDIIQGHLEINKKMGLILERLKLGSFARN